MNTEAIVEDPVRRVRRELAAAHRMAVIDQLQEGTWNHFSVAVPGAAGRMLVTPAAHHWRQVTASNLVMVDRNGMSDGGEYDTAAYYIHQPIHLAREDAVCILHAHPPYATALSMVEGGRLAMADQNAVPLFGRIVYDDTYDGFFLDGSRAQRLVEVAAHARVVFLRNHGVLVIGPTIPEAYTDLYQLERACLFQYLAGGFGGKLRTISPEIGLAAARAADQSGYKFSHFSAMRRLLDAEQPDYLS